MSAAMLGHFDALDRALVAKRFPATSSWWREQIARFYASPCRQLVLRVGRRGGKSSTLCRIAVVEALYGEHEIPPGDTGIVGFVSVSREEATQRLRTIKAILDVLHVKYRERGDSLELADRRVVFRVFTASLSGVVGGTWICAICDEVSRWRDTDTGSNPASEVLASLRPTMATMPRARLFLSSSPLGQLDAHAKAFETGDDAHQLTAYAPSWIANPSVTQEATRQLEPNERAWHREFLAQPQGALTAVFDMAAIDRAIALGSAVTPDATGDRVLVIDPSRGTDAWTYAVAANIWAADKPRLHVAEIGELPEAGDTGKALAWLTDKARALRVTRIISDQYEAGSLALAFSERGFSFYEMKWTAPSKRRAVDHLERRMRDEEILLPASDKMRTQLAEYSEKISRSGELVYAGRGRHDDYAQVLLTATMADLENQIPLVTRPEVSKPLTAHERGRQIEDRAIEQRERVHREKVQAERDWGIRPTTDELSDYYDFILGT